MVVGYQHTNKRSSHGLGSSGIDDRERALGHTLEETLVRNLLEHAADYPWRIQDIGVLGLWLDETRSYRLHVWNPDGAVGEPPIHDHPFDFTSTVVVGELVNTRYVEDSNGAEYVRERYVPGREDDRRVDTVRLLGTSETLRAGTRYRQLAHELHDSRQIPGTVTVLQFEHVSDDLPEVSACRRPGTPWVTGQARTPTPDEVKRITATALALFDDSPPRPSPKGSDTSHR